MKQGKEHVERPHYQLENVDDGSLILLRNEALTFLDIDQVSKPEWALRREVQCRQADFG